MLVALSFPSTFQDLFLYQRRPVKLPVQAERDRKVVHRRNDLANPRSPIVFGSDIR